MNPSPRGSESVSEASAKGEKRGSNAVDEGSKRGSESGSAEGGGGEAIASGSEKRDSGSRSASLGGGLMEKLRRKKGGENGEGSESSKLKGKGSLMGTVLFKR